MYSYNNNWALEAPLICLSLSLEVNLLLFSILNLCQIYLKNIKNVLLKKTCLILKFSIHSLLQPCTVFSNEENT